MEQYLRGCVNYQQDNWVFWLPLAEYLYNNSIHSSTGVSPFEALFGEKLGWSSVVAKERELDVPAARNRAVNMLAMRKIVEKRLEKAVASHAKYYNKKHLDRIYEVSDLVYLNSKNINSTRPTKKLDWKYYGPYRIKERISAVAY